MFHCTSQDFHRVVCQRAGTDGLLEPRRDR